MDFISLYKTKDVQRSHKINHIKQQPNISKQLLGKLIAALQKCLTLPIAFISPQIFGRNQIRQLNNNLISFCFSHDSRNLQYEYSFHVEINLQTCILKIFATILRQGRILNVYKQGITQLLCSYFLNVNSLMNNYSLRVHPFSGAIKFAYINYMTPDHIDRIFKFPVQFSQNIKQHVISMVSRLDERLLGKILHLTNQIPLRDIIPQSFNTNISQSDSQKLKKTKSYNSLYPEGTITNLWGINKKLRDIRKFIANSTIKLSFMHKDSQTERIRFLLQSNLRRPFIQKQQKSVKHNIKPLSFLKDVKKVLHYYTPMDKLLEQEQLYQKVKGQNIWLQLNEQQMKNIRLNLKIDDILKSNYIISVPLPIEKIEDETDICTGGFANISRITVRLAKKLNQNPEKSTFVRNDKICVVKKNAGKQKLFWQKSVINRIGKGNCIFINRYYQLKLQQLGKPNALTQASIDDSIYMEYSPSKSLNYYLAKMNQITSIKTKLFLIFQATIGLRFLRDYDIVHLDMKPQNLLVRNYTSATNSFIMVKIIDFGEAYCSSLIGKINRGHTCPYAPPQLVVNLHQNYQKQKFTQKSDVFSIGVMILMMIFDLNTVDIKRLSSKYIFQKNQRCTKFYSICLEKCKYLYYQPFLQCLLQLAYKCIHPSPQYRPYLNWVCAILNNLNAIFSEIQKGIF